jgi:hypothetical protein
MSYKQEMQKIWRLYEEEHGEEPLSIGECFAWAQRKGLWSPKPLDVAKIFNREMADALRDETRVDGAGREYRSRHCVRKNVGGVQLSLWGDIDKVSRSFFEESVQQRRKGLVDTGYQMKMDVDHFNEYRSPEAPISLVLDLTDDVADREAFENNDKDDDEDAA